MKKSLLVVVVLLSMTFLNCSKNGGGDDLNLSGTYLHLKVNGESIVFNQESAVSAGLVEFSDH